MSKNDIILDLLYKENLTTSEVSIKTGINKSTVGSCISKLRKEGKIKVIDKQGRANVYSCISLDQKKVKESIKPFEVANFFENPKFIDLLMFSYITSYKRPSYSKIQGFFASIGIMDKYVLLAIFRNLGKNLLIMKNVPVGNYSIILEFFIKNSDNFKPKYPFTLKFQEVYNFFKPLSIGDIKDFIDFMIELSKKYPEFLVLSSSRSGQPPDLLTFKQIFIEQIKFIPSGAWSVN